MDNTFIDTSVDAILPDANKHQLDLEFAYLAGFVDGEGYIGISRFPNTRTGGIIHNLTIETSQCNPEPLLKLQSLFGGHVAIKKVADWRGPRRILRRHTVSAKKAEHMLKCLLPYLIVKRDEALVALEFLNQIHDNTEKSQKTKLSQETLEIRDNFMNRLADLKKREF